MQSLLKKKKQKLTSISFLGRESAVRHLVYFVNSCSDSYANKSYEISILLLELEFMASTPNDIWSTLHNGQ